MKLFDYPMDCFKNNSTQTYDLQTKYTTLFNSTATATGYICDKNEVLNNIKNYLFFNKIDKTNLVVSNICVKHISQFQFSCILKLFGIQNIQIAPTTLLTDWSNIKDINFDIFKNTINVYSFQSITYGLNELNIFDETTRDLLFTHITKVIDCAVKNNLEVLVFGCPKNRKIINNAESENNDETFIDFFTKIGDYIGENKLKICIENNSKLYGCNYLNTINEVGEIVKNINHPNIKMMVDIGNAMMENDDITHLIKYKDIIYNIDIANEKMKPFVTYNQTYKEFVDILKTIHYSKKINLEMLLNADNCVDELNMLTNSLNTFILLNS
jgi:sugar phosphate isomerase/epimerase